MSKLRRPKRTTSRHAPPRRGFAPRVETCEERALLSSSTLGFLTGIVYVDGSGSAAATASPLDASKVRVKDAQVTLTSVSTGKVVATSYTDENGQYFFDNLTPGSYVVTEVPPDGYASAGSRANSQLNPVSATTANSITVTVVDPGSVYVNYNGVGPSYQVVNVSVNQGDVQPNSVGQLKVGLGTSAGTTDLNPSYLTLCVDDLNAVSFGGVDNFQAIPTPVTSLTNGSTRISTAHAGQIAYLFNHYGQSNLGSNDSGALQLAVWELLYDSGDTPDFSSGNFVVYGPYAGSQTTDADVAAMVNRATQYVREAQLSRPEAAVFLDAASGSYHPTGLQGMLATGSLDFAVCPRPPAQLCGVVFCDANVDCVQQSKEPGIAGVTVTLQDANGNVVMTTKTGPDGKYSFNNLKPGAYTVVESPAAGYIHEGQSVGTTGGTAGPRTITTTLAYGDSSRQNNFSEHTCTPCSNQFSQVRGNFTCTPLAAGQYVWFNSALNADGVREGTTIHVSNQTIKFTANCKNYTIAVPDSTIVFTAAVSKASTRFDPSTNSWVTTVPLCGASGSIFMGGVGYQVPTGGLPGGICNVTWSGDFLSNTSNVSVGWRWGAATYDKDFGRRDGTVDYNALNVLPTDVNYWGCGPVSAYAGTPQAKKCDYVGGSARGGCGTNYVGVYTCTSYVVPCGPSACGTSTGSGSGCGTGSSWWMSPTWGWGGLVFLSNSCYSSFWYYC